MSQCSCSEYSDLELERECISRRSRESARLKNALTLVAVHQESQHWLYRCSKCGQLWHCSFAWNWGSIEYFFKVPAIEKSDWLAEPYVAPDELPIWCAVLDRFIHRNTFATKGVPCRVSGCPHKAIVLSVLLLATPHCIPAEDSYHASDTKRQVVWPVPPIIARVSCGVYRRDSGAIGVTRVRSRGTQRCGR